MTPVLHAAALVCVVLGLLAAAAVLGRTRDVPVAVGVLLQFLLAAGLLRLSAAASWTALATTAVLVVLRRLLMVGLGGSANRG